MLATRVIPVLLKKGSALVKGTKFNAWRSVGVAMQAARVHAARAVDELIILDVAATAEGRSPDFAAIKELTRDCFCPLAVGGGVRSVEDVRQLLAAGADKVVLGDAVWSEGAILRKLSDTVGRQAVVVCIDCDGERVSPRRNPHRLFIPSAPVWAKIMAEAGAGEILLQSIDRDGTMDGYNIELIRSVAAAVDIPVIACGGCSGPEDMLAAIQAGASAVAAGALFQWTENTPRTCAAYLAEHGIETRIPA